MVFSILKNWNRRCFSYYIIKFIGFMSIYYAINLDIVSSFLFLAICILDLSIYYKFESITLLTEWGRPKSEKRLNIKAYGRKEWAMEK